MQEEVVASRYLARVSTRAKGVVVIDVRTDPQELPLHACGFKVISRSFPFTGSATLGVCVRINTLFRYS